MSKKKFKSNKVVSPAEPSPADHFKNSPPSFPAGKGKKKAPFAFYVIMALIPLLFFVLFEVALRLINYGRNYETFVSEKDRASDMIHLNPEITYKYFGGNIRPVFTETTGFYKEKKENSFRVFVLGESSAQGFPYTNTASFPTYIRRRLDLLYPNKVIEVINLGASAITSFVILDILPAVLKQDPDLILIYTGHNEYYGALGAGSTMKLGSNRQFVNFMLFLRNFKTVEFLRNVIGGAKSLLYAPQEHQQLMHAMIGESAIPLNSEIYNLGLSNFEGNMREILEKIKDARIPVVIGTLTSNIRDLKPFVSQEKDNGKSANDYFKEGHQQLINGNREAAKFSFVKAKELDGLRFRAPEAINKIIRNLAKDYNAPLVDIETLFNSNSVDGVVGFNLMCDHLHPNIAGYQLLGTGYFNTLRSLNLLPKDGRSDLSDASQDSMLLATFPFTRLDSVKAERLLLSMMGSYPFVPQGTPNDLIQNFKPVKFVDHLATKINTDSVRAYVAVEYFQRKEYDAFKRET